MLVGEVARGKALATVVEAAKVVDSNGEPVEPEDEDEGEEGFGGETADTAAEESEETPQV